MSTKYNEGQIKALERDFKRLQRNLGMDYLSYPRWAREFLASKKKAEREAAKQISLPV